MLPLAAAGLEITSTNVQLRTHETSSGALSFIFFMGSLWNVCIH